MRKIRTLIVDDEELGRLRIRTLLRGEPDIEVVGEACDASEALTQIDALSPDLLFLDIQMPEVDGLELAGMLSGDSIPVIVFVTAHDQFALRAFEANAVDYVLKPFHAERFTAALGRARVQVHGKRADDVRTRLDSLLRAIQPEAAYLRRFVIRTGARIQFLKVDDIDWIEADGNYLRAHAEGKQHLLRNTIGGVIERLDPDRFLRIHRSIIVSLDRIREVQVYGKHTYTVILTDGTKLTSSAGYREGLERLIHDHS